MDYGRKDGEKAEKGAEILESPKFDSDNDDDGDVDAFVVDSKPDAKRAGGRQRALA